MPLLYDQEADQMHHIRLHPLIIGHLRVKGLSLEQAAGIAGMSADDFVIACEIGSFGSSLDQKDLKMLIAIGLTASQLSALVTYKMPVLHLIRGGKYSYQRGNLDKLETRQARL